MSKSYAMSGLRLGYLATNDDRLLERMTKLLRCTINGVNSATQHAATAALMGPQDATVSMNRTYQQRRDLLVGALSGAKGLTCFRPEGAFYVWCRLDPSWPGYKGRKDSWAMTDFLLDEGGVGSAPGDVFGPAGSGQLRFAFSCPTEQIEKAAHVLPKLLG
jgi:aspartate aminotransferase